jgi:two-component system sensor histidine kinase YesM
MAILPDFIKEKIRYRSIQFTIALAFSLLIIFTIAVMGLISFKLAEEALESSAQDYTFQLIDQINTSIESYITNMENISNVVLFNKDVQEYFISEKHQQGFNNDEQEIKIAELLHSIARTREDISLILLLGLQGKAISHEKEMRLNPHVIPEEQEWFNLALDYGGRAVVSCSHVQNIIKDEYRWVITLSKSIYDLKSGRSFAVLLVDLNFSVIQRLAESVSLGKKGYIFIIDSSGNIVYHPQQQLIYSALKEERIQDVLNSGENSFIINQGNTSLIYTVKTSRYTGWKIVGVTYAGELISNLQTIQLYYTYWGLICFVFAIILSILISREISRPIKRLRETMQAVELGNFDLQVEIGSGNEIRELGKDFNIMIAKIGELIRQVAAKEKVKRKSELKALQNQITPHFLYNTLDSIIWMAESRQFQNVVTMVSALARLLRLSISKGEELITIGNEIEHISSYLTIQKMRYRDRIDFRIEVDEDILDFKTLKVILQPLVENSIYHGIKSKDGPGYIHIRGFRHDNSVILQIHDDGVGISPEKLKTLLIVTRAAGSGSGVGVRNVNERIKLYFGQEYGLQYQSAANQGTTVNIRLPLIDETKEKEITG